MSIPLLVGTVTPPPGARGGPSLFVQSPPSDWVANAVTSRWHGVGGWDRMLRVLPDGCADVIWNGRQLVVVGAHPEALRFPVDAESHKVGLRLRPGMAGTVLGVPMADLPPGEVPLEDLWGPASMRGLVSRLSDTADSGMRQDLLERVVAARLGTSTPMLAQAGEPTTVVGAVRLLGRPGANVGSVARIVGFSPRELRRRFLAHVGYGPKTLQRVLRFQAFLRDGSDIPLADRAAKHGYADQSHLGRECRRLAGSSPARLVAGLGRNVPDRAGATGAR